MVACMAVMARERWTDEQLDKAFGRADGDLREIRVEMRKGFEHIDQRFEQIDQRFEQMEKRFDKVDERFDKVDKRFDQIITWLVSLSCTIIGSLVAGVIASQALG
jgi:tetrahydromethanopterin S-methyltransferase subunit G